MKKLTIAAVMTVVFGLSLVRQARAEWLCSGPECKSSSQKSLGVGVGMLSGPMKLEGAGSVNSTSPLLDLDLLFHRKVMTWGIGYKNRNSKSPLDGDLKYNGGSVLLGYYSNKEKTSLLGWHILGGLGVGSLTGISAGYKRANLPTQAQIGLGLDVVLRKHQDSPVRRPSADVLSLDARYDGFAVRILPNNATKTTTSKLLGLDGLGLAMTFSHYFALK